MRWTFEERIDLGDLGYRKAIIQGDVKVTWAREPEDGFDDVRVDVRTIEVYIPEFNRATKCWTEKLVDFTGFIMGPGGEMLRQRLETHLETEHEQEILDSYTSPTRSDPMDMDDVAG